MLGASLMISFKSYIWLKICVGIISTHASKLNYQPGKSVWYVPFNLSLMVASIVKAKLTTSLH